ncbi:DUF3048 domain-containing protein [Streptomyces longwoodensis]|uniref:DUF3048 domain-containing protein n=1 Tax=Streptomyces longwoodensis TaxID=68231 RepID=UPI0036F7F01A
MTPVDKAHGPRTRRSTFGPALLAAALALGLAAGCTSSRDALQDKPGGSRSPAASSSASASPSPRTPPPGPVLAVKIDNAPAARPPTGLDAADVVYAEQVEGGLSRLMALYATKLPPAVGPVRSARESDLELLGQFTRPVLAFSGAQGKLLPLIDRAPLTAVTPEESSGAFYRGADRAAPHNLFLRPKTLVPSPPGAAALTTGFRYGAAPPGGTPEKTRSVRFPAARFTFTWSPDRARWLVAMDDRASVTSGGRRVAAATVVVQYVTVRGSRFHDFLGNTTPYTRTVGSGRATVLRDGRAFDAHWERPTATDGTRFTTPDGAAMTFAPGQVWVVLAAAPGGGGSR